MQSKIHKQLQIYRKDYALPFWSTLGFVFLIVVLLVVRLYQQNLIDNVLGESSKKGNNYSRLLSNDTDKELKKNDVTENDKSNTSTTTNSSLSINASGGQSSSSATNTTSANQQTSGSTTQSSTQPSSGNNTSSSGSTTSSSGTTTPPIPFSAQLSGFGLRSQSATFFCGTSGTPNNLSQYCKQYDFVAVVNTFNGPGTVDHKIVWQGVNGGVLSGNFSAPAGDALKQVSYSVKLQCDRQGTYLFQFYLLSPTQFQSNPVWLPHNCSTV